MLDAVSIIVGMVVGASIFQTAPLILQLGGTSGLALLLWAAGGLVSLLGAFVYAELATAYPRDGGDYVYLTRAFGRCAGFLFAWAKIAVILTANIGMMAFVFAGYAGRVFPALAGASAEAAAAVAAVLVLTAFNVVGVVFGKTVQNVLSVLKVVGLGAILVAGFCFAPAAASWAPAWPAAADLPPVGADVALILILYAYGGWNDAALVAAEVRDVRRNLSRALFWGIGLVTALYLLVNAAYVNGLGYTGAARSTQVAADVLRQALGRSGEVAMSLIVATSALGAINGLVFTGSRVYATVGRDHHVFGWMGRWSNARGTPTAALAAQALVAAAVILLVGLPRGQQLLLAVVRPLGIDRHDQPWQPRQGFDYLLVCSTPVFWVFFLLTGLSLFVLRWREPGVPRPFRVPLYPVAPALFCLSCAFMTYRSVEYAVHGQQAAGGLLLLGVAPVLAGLPLYAVSWWLEKKPTLEEAPCDISG
jgi:amino acid transporter